MVQPRVLVRPARHEDAAAIAEIYNQGIRGRGATFETEERTVEERERWLAGHGPEHPCQVALAAGEDGERVVGWASTSSYRSRECYQGIAEFSVYVREDWRGHKVGKALLEALDPMQNKGVNMVYPPGVQVERRVRPCSRWRVCGSIRRRSRRSRGCPPRSSGGWWRR